MDRIETGKTIEEAKQLLMKNLHLGDFDTVDFEVIQEPTKGFLGIGSKDAEVKLIVKTDKLKKAQHLLKEMAKHLGYEPVFKVGQIEENNQVKIEFTGEVADELFGHMGRSAKKWEFLINCMINQKDRNDYLKIVFEHEKIYQGSGSSRSRSKGGRDRKKPSNRAPRNENSQSEETAEASGSKPERQKREIKDSRDRDRKPRNDRQKNRSDRSSNSDRKSNKPLNPVREKFLITTAKNMAKKAIESESSVKLNPMNSFERRIIHTELQDMENIVTKSEGDGDKRHVVIEFTG